MYEHTDGDKEILEQLAAMPGWGPDDTWLATIEWLGLPESYIPALRETLAQDGWRAADDPVRYVVEATMHRAARRGVPDDSGGITAEPEYIGGQELGLLGAG